MTTAAPERRADRALRRRLPLLVALLLPFTGGVAEAQSTSCGPETTGLTGVVGPEDAKSYLMLPVEVPEGTARIELAYTWDPLDDGVIDLGTWDASGTAGPDAFRSWSGNRQGRIDRDMDPVVIEPGRIERTVVDGEVEPGTWHVELGVAAVDSELTWRVEVTCPTGESGEPLDADPVDPTHVARDEPGWYAGDFHLHGYHSHPEGPDPARMVELARDAGLDIVPVTEYVTPAHWDRLGETQRDNPDLLIWPGREVITYRGHMIVLGETPSVVEHRVGHDGIALGDVQRPAAGDGALVALAHPTLFPPEQFGSTCRGCYFELLDDVDWDSTHLIEVVTAGSIAEVGGTEVPNPFVRTAVELWEEQLRAGHRLTAVSGSDDKLGDDYGRTTTMVWAEQLSRPAVDEALRRGHAYVRGLGAASPEVEVTAVEPVEGARAMVGDTLVAQTAELSVTVTDGDGTILALRRNGTEVERVPVRGDSFTFETTIDRTDEEGPLGTFWGVEVLDTQAFEGAEVVSVITNPVFLADQLPPEPDLPDFASPAAPDDDGGVEDGDDDGSVLPWVLVGAAAGVAASAGAAVWRRRRRDMGV